MPPNKKHSSKIHYWQSISGNEALLNQYKPIIDKLRSGDYQAADLDLKMHKKIELYTARINQSDRLLFATIMRGGERCLHLIEVILNHNYRDSRLANKSIPAFLATCSEPNTGTQVLSMDVQNFVDADEQSIKNIQELSSKLDSDEDPVSLSYYAGTFIQYNADQINALGGTKKIISGPPGCGKTCVGKESLLEFHSNKIPVEGEKNPTIYVTKEQYLVDQMKELIKVEGISSTQIQCLTYHELMCTLNAIPADKNPPITEKRHLELIAEHISRIRDKERKQGSSSTSISHPNNVHEVLREFYTICGYDNLQDYMDRGKFQTNYSNELKRLMWDSFKAYKAYLKDNKIINVEFTELSSAKPFWSKVEFVVDEAQDFTPRMLLELYKCTENIICCLDTLQTTTAQVPNMPYLVQLFGGEQFHAPLNSSFRCPETVTEQANQVIKVRIALTGKADKYQYASISSTSDREEITKGEVKWIDQNELAKLNTAYANSVAFAVVTHEEHLEEARRLFNTPLIFTINQIKGSDFPYILAYKVVSSAYAPKVNHLINDEVLSKIDADSQVHRSKNGIVDSNTNAYFSAIYAAWTRSKDKLFIFEVLMHTNSRLINALNLNAVAKNKKPVELAKEKQPEVLQTKNVSTEEEWIKFAHTLYQKASTRDQAEAIFLKYGIPIPDLVTHIEVPTEVAINETETVAMVSETPVEKNSSNKTQSKKNKQNKKTTSSKEKTHSEATSIKPQESINTVLEDQKTLVLDKPNYDVEIKTDSIEFMMAVNANNFIGAVTVLNRSSDVLRRKFIIDNQIMSLETPLTVAIKNNFINIITLIVNQLGDDFSRMYAYTKITSKDSYSPFILAVGGKRYDIVRALLQSINSEEKRLELINSTPVGLNKSCFQQAVEMDSILLVREMLVSVSLKAKDKLITTPFDSGYNAMTYAAEHNYESMITTLTLPIRKMPELIDLVLKKDAHGDSALLVASRNGATEIAKNLLAMLVYESNELSQNQLINDKDKTGQSSLMIAAEKGHLKILLNFLRVISKLENQKKAILQQDNQGQNALMSAAANNQKHAVMLMLSCFYCKEEQFEAINQKNANGQSAIMLAMTKNYTEIYNIFIKVADEYSDQLKTAFNQSTAQQQNQNNLSTAPNRFFKYSKEQEELILADIKALTNAQEWTIGNSIPKISCESLEQVIEILYKLAEADIGSFQMKVTTSAPEVYKIIAINHIDYQKLRQLNSQELDENPLVLS